MGKLKQTETKDNVTPESETALVNRGETGMSKQAVQAERMAGIQLLLGSAEFDNFDQFIETPGLDRLDEPDLVEAYELEGVPFLVVGVDQRIGDFGPYISATCVLATREIKIYNDGSTGVMRQLNAYQQDKGTITPQKPLAVPGGLRASHYKYTDPRDGSQKPATTWYLSGRKPKKNGTNQPVYRAPNARA